MVDNIIDFDGFEKYGSAVGSWYNIVPNYLNFASSTTPLTSQSFLQEWYQINYGGNSPACGLISGLANTGGVAIMLSPAFGNTLSLIRNMPLNYSRIILGFAMMSAFETTVGIYLGDIGAGQCFLGVDTGGRIVFNGASNLYTSGSLIRSNTRHYFEIDVTIHNTAGTYKIWMDSVLLASGSNVNTRAATSNNYTNCMILTNNANGTVAFDDMYWRDNTTGSASPFGDCTIKPLIVTSDSATQFVSGGLLANWIPQQTVTTANSGAQISLVPVTPTANMTVNSIGLMPRTTLATAKFQGVIYSDNAGAPGSLLSSGTEVIGTTSGFNLTLPLTTPQAVSGGIQYWIGYIGDSNVALQLSDTWSGTGQVKANTYASGAPAGPLAGMTIGQNPISMWGVCSGLGGNFAGVDKTIVLSQKLALGFNKSSTPSAEDLFNVTTLPQSLAAIKSVKVSVMAQIQPNSGLRTMDIRIKSGSIESAGSNPGINLPSGSPMWYSTKFDTDPNTNAAWTAAGISAAQIGYKIAT